MKKAKLLNWNRKCILCMMPGFIGTAVFFAFPFLRILYYSLIDNQFNKKFVWLKNYADALQNEYFRLALKNSLLLIVIGVPLLIVVAVTVSLVLSYGIRFARKLRAAFIFPMLVPTAGIVLLWQECFAWSDTALPIYLLFVWKNIGICVILLTAAFSSIDSEIFEAARLDGAGGVRLHTGITIPIIYPTILFTTLLAVVYSFRIFKESYLYYGDNYPPEHSYTLQYYMNNHFLKFDYQALAAGSVIVMLLVMIIVCVGLNLQKRSEL